MRIVVHGQQAFGKSVLEALARARGKRRRRLLCPRSAPGRAGRPPEGGRARPRPAGPSAAIVSQQARGVGGIRAAQGGSLRDGLRHAHRARGGAESAHARHDPVPSVAAPAPPRAELDQLADHHGRDAHRAHHLLARPGARYRADPLAEGRRDPGHRYARQPLLRPAVSARGRGAARGRRSGARRQGAEDRSGRVQGDV